MQHRYKYFLQIKLYYLGHPKTYSKSIKMKKFHQKQIKFFGVNQNLRVILWLIKSIIIDNFLMT